MKIDSSSITQSSSRTFAAVTSYSQKEVFSNNLVDDSSIGKNLNSFNSQLYDSLGQTSSISSSQDTVDYRQEFFRTLLEFMEKVRENLISNLTKGETTSKDNSTYLSSTFSVDASSSTAGNVWSKKTISSWNYYESETTTFSSMGTVKTANGDTINFNIDMNMSRSFMQNYTSITEDTVSILTDPLVINLSSSPTSIDDVSWNFDIDGDGSMDTISMLSKGSGFLALDKNGNGKIDDGKELFGARTGNGFDELKEYDEDHNGWIDENDKVYNDLKVWLKDSSGNDKLINLKEANIGAIYLGNSKTDYSINNLETNNTLAQIRRTGIYLTENGEANSIQQIDFAKIS